MSSGDLTPRIDTTRLVETLTEVVAPGQRINGSPEVTIQRLDSLARQALGQNGASKPASQRKLLDALVDSIRGLDQPASKARLAALLHNMALRQSNEGQSNEGQSNEGQSNEGQSNKELARKLATRALNYAEQVDDPAERAAELLRVLDILSGGAADGKPSGLSLEDSLRHAIELVRSVADQSRTDELKELLAAVAAKLGSSTLVPADLRVKPQAAGPARNDAHPEAPRSRPAPQAAPQVSAKLNGDGFIDPAAGIVFPTARRRRR
ncbi:MAG: hypothetical protein AB1486_19120 [Planctomycetota bacterium]